MKILVASVISPTAMQQLQARHEVIEAIDAQEPELKERIAQCEALVFRSGVQITAPVMASAPGLRLLVRAGSGLENIDLDYVESRGLTLVRVPGPGAQAVAEMAFALMLGLSRQLLEADRLLRQGRWAKHELPGRLLQGKTLGVVGAGNIGGRVARMGVAWGMPVVACVKHPGADLVARFKADGIEVLPMQEVLARSDYVSVHVPLAADTRKLISAEELAWMKPTAFLVNLARGGVVDEAALLAALTGNRLAGAGLDVHEAEGEGKISALAGLSQVLLTPHIGATTSDSQDAIGREIVAIIDAGGAAQGAAE